MSDRFTATISIHKTHIKKFPELEALIRAEFYNENGKLYDDDCWDENSPIATFKDCDARWGEFAEIQDLCQKLHIPYDRWHTSYDDMVECTYHYRPDIDSKDDFSKEILPYPLFTLEVLERLPKKTNIPKDNPAYTAEIGKIFLNFLQNIPRSRPLEEYKDYDFSN